MKMNTARHSTAASLYRLAFDDVVSDLRKATAAAVAETTPRPVARPIRPRTSPQPRSRRATSRPAPVRKSQSPSPPHWGEVLPLPAPLENDSHTEGPPPHPRTVHGPPS